MSTYVSSSVPAQTWSPYIYIYTNTYMNRPRNSIYSWKCCCNVSRNSHEGMLPVLTSFSIHTSRCQLFSLGCCLLGQRLTMGDMILLPQNRGGIVRDWFWHASEGLLVRHDDFEFAPWHFGLGPPLYIVHVLYKLCLAVCPLSGASAISNCRFQVIISYAATFFCV